MREVDTLSIAYHSPALDAFSGELRTGACPAACAATAMQLHGTSCQPGAPIAATHGAKHRQAHTSLVTIAKHSF